MGSPQQFILGSKMKWTLCLFFVASAAAVPKGRVLGLFSVVTFPNDECTTISTPAMSGICVTAEECSNSGDTIAVASGNCASGFGVCCMRRIVAPGSITYSECRLSRSRNCFEWCCCPSSNKPGSEHYGRCKYLCNQVGIHQCGSYCPCCRYWDLC